MIPSKSEKIIYRMEKNICKSHIWELVVLKIYKELFQVNNNKMNKIILKWQMI